MKIAITYEDGKVYQHFGHTAQFKFYEIEDGKVVSSEIVDTNGSGHGALASFLAERGVEGIICGGIGGGAVNALRQAGISVYPGVTGHADECAKNYAAGRLLYNPNAQCSSHHHDHEHGGECSSHSCSSHDSCSHHQA